MTEENLIDLLTFSSDAEKEDAAFYLKAKGISLNLQVIRHLGQDINHKNEIIEWTRISSLLRYDKKLRDKTYIYLATLEEYIRAYISNKYDDFPQQKFWINGKVKIFDKINAGEKVFDILLSTEFNDLMRQVNNLSEEDKNGLFPSVSELRSNLDAVRKLRNAISHHCFLMDYDFAECTVCSITGKTLLHNLKNLRQLLPKEYRYGRNGNGGITAEINNCRYERNRVSKEQKLMKLNEKDIILLD